MATDLTSRRYRLQHATRYHYEQPVLHSFNVTCLQPRQTTWQHVHWTALQTEPALAHHVSFVDAFGNERQLLHVPQAHTEFAVTLNAELTVTARHSEQWLGQTCALEVLQQLSSHTEPWLAWCRRASPLVPLLPEAAAIWRRVAVAQGDVLDNIQRLNHWIYSEFAYVPAATSISTPLVQVLQQRQGVCQDFAHLAIAVLRSQGIAARYVSGYLETLAPAGQEKLQGADASHAWFEVFVPPLGWVGFDPTNNLMPDVRHLQLAVGRDFSDVTPLKGVVQGRGEHQLQVAVDVLAL